MKSLLLTFLFFFSVSAHAQETTLSGTMHLSTLEGGCWYLQNDTGKRFELTGDARIINGLHVEGEHVTLRAVPAKSMASICMMGEIVRVLQRVDTVRYPTDPVISPIMVDGTVHRTKSGVWYVITKSGLKFEFEDTPDQKYRKIGAAVHQRFRILLDRKYSKANLNGVILSEVQLQLAKPSIAKQKIYDNR
jgi:hypothetical protein